MRHLPIATCARAAALLAAAAGAVAFSGCSRPVGSLSGKVTYKNSPLKGGNMTFVSTEGQPSASATIAEDGTYKVPRLTGGSYKVCVETASLKPGAVGGGAGPASPGGLSAAPAPSKDAVKGGKVEPGTAVPEGYVPSSPAGASLALARANSLKKYVPIPDQYADPAKTDLTYDFPGGDQTYDIVLK